MSQRPNIVFILMDDLGRRDLSCMGSTFYETPNLDRRSAEGMLLTDAYAACPVCSPSRQSATAGKDAARLAKQDPRLDPGGQIRSRFTAETSEILS